MESNCNRPVSQPGEERRGEERGASREEKTRVAQGVCGFTKRSDWTTGGPLGQPGGI